MTTTWDLAYPDLSGVAGFDPAWALRKGETSGWGVYVFGGDYIPFNTESAPAEGAAYRLAFRRGGPFTSLRGLTSGVSPSLRHGLGGSPVPLRR